MPKKGNMASKVKLRLAPLRRERGITQSELGDAVGLEQSTISRIECGRQTATLAVLERMADYLGVSLLDLFDHPDRSEIEREISKALAQLEKAEQKALLDFAHYLRSRNASS